MRLAPGVSGGSAGGDGDDGGDNGGIGGGGSEGGVVGGGCGREVVQMVARAKGSCAKSERGSCRMAVMLVSSPGAVWYEIRASAVLPIRRST